MAQRSIRRACDAMLINAGVTHLYPPWLDRLREGGRLVLPLTVAMGATLGEGVVAKITRPGDYLRSDLFLYQSARSAIGAAAGEGHWLGSVTEIEVRAPGPAHARGHLPLAWRAMFEQRRAGGDSGSLNLLSSLINIFSMF